MREQTPNSYETDARQVSVVCIFNSAVLLQTSAAIVCYRVVVLCDSSNTVNIRVIYFIMSVVRIQQYVVFRIAEFCMDKWVSFIYHAVLIFCIPKPVKHLRLTASVAQTSSAAG